MSPLDSAPSNRLEDLLNRPAKERIAYIQRDRWIPVVQADRALRRMERCLASDPQLRTLGVLLWGPSNSGKSATLTRFIRKHAPASVFDEETGVQRIPLVDVECPPEADEPRLYDAIAERLCPFLNWPGRSIGSSLRSIQWDVYRALAEVRPKILAIDNLNNFVVFTGNNQAKALAGVRRLVTVTKVVPVFLGTENVRAVMRTDRQLLERFAFIELRGLDRTTEFPVFARKLAASYPLRQRAPLSDDMLELIFEASQGLVGRVVSHLKEAGVLAVESGSEQITPEILQAEQVLEALEATRLAAELANRGKAR